MSCLKDKLVSAFKRLLKDTIHRTTNVRTKIHCRAIFTFCSGDIIVSTVLNPIALKGLHPERGIYSKQTLPSSKLQRIKKIQLCIMHTKTLQLINVIAFCDIFLLDWKPINIRIALKGILPFCLNNPFFDKWFYKIHNPETNTNFIGLQQIHTSTCIVTSQSLSGFWWVQTNNVT